VDAFKVRGDVIRNRADNILQFIAGMWIAIVLTIYSFSKVEPLAAALLLPYLAWVSFATVLNYTIVSLNPQVLTFLMLALLKVFYSLVGKSMFNWRLLRI
jgi:TspO/MBR family